MLEIKNEIEKAKLLNEPGDKIAETGLSACSYCGRYVESRLTFCTCCGAKKVNYIKKRVNDSDILLEQPVGVNGDADIIDKALYSNSSVFYLRGLVPTSGTLFITEHSMRFIPQPLYFFKQPVTIMLQDIAEISFEDVAGYGLCIKLITNFKIMHKFALGQCMDAAAIHDIITGFNKRIS